MIKNIFLFIGAFFLILLGLLMSMADHLGAGIVLVVIGIGIESHVLFNKSSQNGRKVKS